MSKRRPRLIISLHQRRIKKTVAAAITKTIMVITTVTVTVMAAAIITITRTRVVKRLATKGG